MAATDSDDTVIEDEYEQDAISIADVETTCRICHAEFLDSEDLNVHVKQVHVGSPSCLKICQFCDTTYTDLEDYARHIRDDHLFELKCCRGCTKCFTDLRKARKHEKKHFNQSDMYACSQCIGLFTSQIELELHEIINHDNKDDGDILRCMPHLSSLLKLKAVALLQADEKVLVCRACDFTSVDLNAYIDHLEDQKCSVFVCDRCANVFRSRKNLIKHLNRKNKCMYPKEFLMDLTTCKICKNEVHATQMRSHLKYCKSYTCRTCDVTFDTIVGLSSHQSEAHPLELDVIKCKYCPREYVGQESLDKHIERSHRHQFILYKYMCKSCDAIFKHPQTLFAHYFTKHKDIEPYTCKICDKKFRVRKRFTIHIKLEHKGNGVVEFDEQYHVFFAEKKSENPFIPKCVIPELVPVETKRDKNVSEKAKDTPKSGVQKLKRKKSVSDSGALGLSAMETEADENVYDTKEDYSSAKLKKKRRKRKVKDFVVLTSSEDEAEPLLIIKKRAERKRFQKRFLPDKKTMKQQIMKRKQFTCNVCQKYCYTYQNYHNHIKIHNKNESIECVKCSRSFRTKNELTEHITTDHSTSKLIETLKTVLERKNVETQNNSPSDTNFDAELEPSERFLRTIKRVKLDKPSVPAKIVPAPSDLSVKNFIENFVPDTNEAATKASTEPNDVKLDPIVTIRRYSSPFYRKHSIKMSKFTPEPDVQNFQLKLPEKFKEQYEEKVNLRIRIVQETIKQSMFESYEKTQSYDTIDNSQDYDDYDNYKDDAIPEVAEEVMLEESEELPKENVKTPHKIVIPKLPKDYPNIHIATLTQEAPYYKIIKVKGTKDNTIVLDTDDDNNKKKEKPKTYTTKDEIISLPDGTKFVTANPLAHLLGDKSVEQFVEPVKSKKYNRTTPDFKGLLAEALLNLDKPTQKKKRKAEMTEGVEKIKKRSVNST